MGLYMRHSFKCEYSLHVRVNSALRQNKMVSFNVKLPELGAPNIHLVAPPIHTVDFWHFLFRNTQKFSEAVPLKFFQENFKLTISLTCKLWNFLFLVEYFARSIVWYTLKASRSFEWKLFSQTKTFVSFCRFTVNLREITAQYIQKIIFSHAKYYMTIANDDLTNLHAMQHHFDFFFDANRKMNMKLSRESHIIMILIGLLLFT